MATIYSVGQINQYIRNMFAQDYLLENVSVRGEVSNCKYHSSGHIYFTLKENGSAISCVMFASSRSHLNFTMADGQQVVVKGKVEVYVRDGKYQLYASDIEKDGEGNLFLAFEQLKRRLKEEGMFDEEFKRPIPKQVRTLGVVTAPTGAAVRDIISVSKRRNPYIQIILYPAVVQGDGAAESIVKGMEALENYGVDVMIVGRGGGSIEDLWAFNEEVVAHAIFQCGVPVISAVGHETDFTIADFVADKRAATPSAAAELAVEEFAKTDKILEDYRNFLNKEMVQKLLDKKMQLRLLGQKLSAASPEAKVRELRLKSTHVREKMESELAYIIRMRRMQSIQLREDLEGRMQYLLQDKRNQLNLLIQRMHGVSPIQRLQSGVAYISSEKGARISCVSDMRQGDVVRIRMKDGIAHANVLDVKSEG